MGNFKINIPVLLVLFSILNSCQHEGRERIIENYIKGLNTSDFSIISSTLTDHIHNHEQEFILAKNLEEFYIQFQWDSVFQPGYDLSILKIRNDTIEALVTKNCKRIHFLHDTSLISLFRFELEDNRITKIQLTEYKNMNLELWQQNRNKLVSWIDENHPQLHGFIHDMSVTGAKNYLKAIELYATESEKVHSP
jgi:hypothetical protein